MFSKTNKDPLVESARKVIAENDIRRKVERQINEELGIESRKQLPREMLADYDAVLAEAVKKALDPVGQEDPDVDNDGDTDSSDSYLKNRRKTVAKAINKNGQELEEADQYSRLGLQAFRGQPNVTFGPMATPLEKAASKVGEYVPVVAPFAAGMALARGDTDAAMTNAMNYLPLTRAVSKAGDFLDTMRADKPQVNPNAATGGLAPSDIAAQDVGYDAVRKNLFPGDYDQKKIDGQMVHVNEPVMDKSQYDDTLKNAVRMRLGLSQFPVKTGEGPWGPRAAGPARDLRGRYMPEQAAPFVNAPKPTAPWAAKMNASADEMMKRNMGPRGVTKQAIMQEEQTDAQQEKVAKVMREYKKRKLHSGSKKGPIVRKRSQAIAIALNQAGLSNQQNENFDIASLNEEIAVNNLNIIKAIYEQNGDEGVNAHMQSLDENIRHIIEAYLDEAAFGVRFQEARRKGETEFEFGGKRYKSIMKGETEDEWKAKMAKNAAPPVPMERRADRPGVEQINTEPLKTVPVTQTDLPPVQAPVAKGEAPATGGIETKRWKLPQIDLNIIDK